MVEERRGWREYVLTGVELVLEGDIRVVDIDLVS